MTIKGDYELIVNLLNSAGVKVNLADLIDDTLYGVHADTKPTDNIRVGRTYFEFDTGHGYIFDGTTWQGPY